MPQQFFCPVQGCGRSFKSQRGRTYHVRSLHSNSNRVSRTPSPSVSNPAPDSPPPSPVLADEDIPPAFHDQDPAQAEGPAPAYPSKTFHPYLTGAPCDSEGNYLPAGTPPPPRPSSADRPWAPYENELQFRTADFLYRQVEMSAGNIDTLLELWASSLEKSGELGPFGSYEQMYATIDSTRHGDVPWKCFTTGWAGDILPGDATWKSAEYEVWYRDPDEVIKHMLDNPDFDGQFDYAGYVGLDKSGKRHWSDFMSGNYVYRHSTTIYDDDPTTRGAMYCPIILGSDKTTVSVATGHVEYHPLYLSIGGVHNTVRRAHRNAVIPIGFLAIPKGDRKYDNDTAFRKFKRQMYHSSIEAILQSLKPGMTTPVVRRCPDGHFRRVIYDLAAYIADYPEQVYLAGVVQNWCPKCTATQDNLDGPGGRRTEGFTDNLANVIDSKTLWDEYGIDDDITPFTVNFPRADIHEMLSADLLHQLIKGTFKDHLVQWVGDYLFIEHGEARANEILDDIDRRIAASPLFPGLRHFPHGRRFKQWTGDDSKALMKVYLPAIAGHVPAEMVQCIAAFLDACYIARRADITEKSVAELEAAIKRFHTHREIFRTTGVRPTGFSLPRQHSLIHYPHQIHEFGAPGGLCSSITESRHITAVKRPWRRSNRYEALGQMLLTNQRLDKLAASRADFENRGMLPRSRAPPPKPVLLDNDRDGPTDEYVTGNVTLARTRQRKIPRDLHGLAEHIQKPELVELTRRFLHDQTHRDGPPSSAISLDACPTITSKISVFNSAVATFYAPSDESGIRGMKRESIRSTESWRKKDPRRDCALVVEDQAKPGMKGLGVVRVLLFFSFDYRGKTYPCALVEWFKTIGSTPDKETGMWRVRPDISGRRRLTTVLHLDSFLRGAHLLPVFGSSFLPVDFHFSYSLDAFEAYYVSKYADHQMHEICF
ncbi:hypothetical protein BDZ97DRAFT_1681013 [Flammula alnicola]|nr:hypothetical protein BDZ97DRAFT_1681013 [Flammula alnicola]